MRTFIALELPEDFRNDIAQLSSQLQKAVQGRFLSRDTYHITLAFIGETDDAESSRIVHLLDSPAIHNMEIPLRPTGLGKFGKSQDATLFLALDPNEALLHLTETIRAELTNAQISFDNKKFRPHITLARRATLPKGPLPELLFPQPAKAGTITFFKSILKPEGAEYKPLYSIEINKQAPIHRRLLTRR